MLVTALEAPEEDPKKEIVTKGLFFAERKWKVKSGITEFSEDRTLTTKRHFDHQCKKGPQCHYCKKFGYT